MENMDFIPVTLKVISKKNLNFSLKTLYGRNPLTCSNYFSKPKLTSSHHKKYSDLYPLRFQKLNISP